MLRTPLRASPWLSGVAGAEVRLKLETLQPTFSYKIRGALNAVLRLSEESGGRLRPLVTASAGNHGRALAHACRAAGLRVTVYASEHAPRVKLEAIRAEGARLRLCADYDEAERQAKAHATASGATFVSPYADPDVIAGAGTIGLEIVQDFPDVDSIVVPVGGGGLISGIALAARTIAPRASVAGVEAEASSPFTAGLAAGHIVPIDVRPTLADGLAGNLDPDTPTFEIVRATVDRIVRVSESELGAALAGVIRHERLVVEGAGAAAVAAVLSGKVPAAGRNIAVVLSGANVDDAVLANALDPGGDGGT